jgi:kojibiose phosphorylase
MKIEGFIFDLDGVLTDTAEYHYRAWKRLADEEGIPFDREDNEALRGISRRESLLLMLKGRPLSEEQMQVWMERKNNYYRQMLAQMTPSDILPGSKEFLNELRAAGIKIALASASKNARDVLAYLKLHDKIDVLCDGNSVEKAKPAPDLFLFAAHQLDLPPEVCVVVEDAEAGVEAALAAGMRCIGLGPEERVGKATLVLPNLESARWDVVMQQLG